MQAIENNQNEKMGDGLLSIEKLLQYRKDVIIENVQGIKGLYNVTFLDKRAWMPSCTIMEELKITFCGCGLSNLGYFFVSLSTYKQDLEVEN